MQRGRFLGAPAHCLYYLDFKDLHQRLGASIRFCSGGTGQAPRGVTRPAKFANTNHLLLSLATDRRTGPAIAPPSNPRRRLSTRNDLMNPAELPFDLDHMLQGLRVWVECESPTWNANAVNSMLDLAARDMAIMGATIER